MKIGIVVIGRNEGARLRVCLQSACEPARPIVYVDSGSVDDSVAIARSYGVDVLDLDPARPFSAARARNEGFTHLLGRHPALEFVQFVDGDCELEADWISSGLAVLDARPELAIVAGQLHERSPDASIYNRLGDLEWNFAGAGEVNAVGGIFMIRREAFENAGGFDLTVTAGEEPELCQRLSRLGWRILRLERRMALHDLAMTRFAQWWKRQIRTGHGGLDVALRFGLPEYQRMTRRARFWSAWPFLVPAAGLTAGRVMGHEAAIVAALLVASLWPAQLMRIALRSWRSGQPINIALAYAWFTLLSFWPQMLGQWHYWNDRRLRRSARLVEYKAPARKPDQPGALRENSTGGIS